MVTVQHRVYRPVCYVNRIRIRIRIEVVRPTLSETATDVMRESVKREVITHHALRITYSASRPNLAARCFHPYRRAAVRGDCFENSMIVGCGRIARPTLGESAKVRIAYSVFRPVVTQYAIRNTSHAALAARHFRRYRRGVARRRTAL